MIPFRQPQSTLNSLSSKILSNQSGDTTQSTSSPSASNAHKTETQTMLEKLELFSNGPKSQVPEGT